MKKIIALDKWLFVKINRQGANDFFDWLMPLLRQPLIWAPFYLFLIIFVIINFKNKVVVWLLLAGTTVAATDLTSSRIFKPLVGRLRPCNDIDMATELRMLVNYCGQNGSFTSSHAANHFGIAMFLFITLRDVWGNWCWLFFLWAAAISYAQVYVGVHFPLDVIAGAAMGCIFGRISGDIFIKKSGHLSLGKTL